MKNIKIKNIVFITLCFLLIVSFVSSIIFYNIDSKKIDTQIVNEKVQYAENENITMSNGQDLNNSQSTVYNVSEQSSSPIVETISEVDDSVEYTADFSNGLPSDWSIFNKSEVDLTSHEKSDSGLIIRHNDKAGVLGGYESKYYGGLYNIATSVGNLIDFELTLTYKVKSYSNVSRFIGILYHTQTADNGNLEGYMMTYRVRGKSEQATFNSEPSFSYNISTCNTKTPSFADGVEHTIKITMENGLAQHYVDGTALYNSAYDTASYDDFFGGNLVEGGFGLIVNKSEIEITGLTITGTKGADQARKRVYDDTFVDVYVPETAPLNAPSVIAEINSQSDLTALQNTIRAQTAIVKVDENLNVLDSSSNPIGSFKSIYTGYIQGNAIPAIYVSSQAVADVVKEYLTLERLISDIAVVSDSYDILKYLRNALPNVHGIIDLSSQTVSNYAEIVANANTSKAITVLLSESSATYEAVTYMQARYISVWAKSDALSSAKIASLISTGVYGIVTSNPINVYNVYNDCGDVMANAPYIVAHRGMACDSYAENTMEAFIGAYENGATHIEIDVKITSDNKLVIYHDDSINEKTAYTGTKKVEEMTLAEIQAYKVFKNSNGATVTECNIPTLENVFEYFDDKDIVILVEVKSYYNDAIYTEMRNLIEQYSMADNIVFISNSINNTSSKLRQEFPNIATADLMSEAITSTHTLLQVVKDFNSSSLAASLPMAIGEPIVDVLKARGFISSAWTYNDQTDINVAIDRQITLITCNYPEKVQDYARRLIVDNYTITLDKASIDTYDFNTNFVTYSGENVAVDSQIAFRVDYDTYSEIVLKAKFIDETTNYEYILLSECITVNYN